MHPYTRPSQKRLHEQLQKEYEERYATYKRMAE